MVPEILVEFDVSRSQLRHECALIHAQFHVIPSLLGSSLLSGGSLLQV